ncbi:hypothetical protein [Dactylosporangium sp. NPDC050588]|uniref:hypothetical protein n=1 Tax=Dactylosporangium sp. NPDC050588 TaxID=3157211 RepID=UPI0033DDFA3C
MGERDVVHGAGDPGRFGRDPPQDRGDQVPDADLRVAEQDGGVRDAALRVGLEPLREAVRQVGRVAPGVQAPVGPEQHGGGQQRRAVEEQLLDAPVGPLQHRDRRGRAEVDAQPGPRTRHGAAQ